ncbi:hypothetical protein C7S18_04015 [Ahniella affigens]|uniref:Uncharacterized protein n=1 Tax=Ahniella affigens TaxID=2021234 RepID=A0A2P1PNJ4_9GAMM|nr:heme-binding protein [Ahniella affigens]AVP96409.1 hypothetical protein C7S18_04015 [Ahniella affigens]
MQNKIRLANVQAVGREVSKAVAGTEILGPLKLLPGVWANLPNLPGRGWNMIALPFATPPGSPFPFNYRLLLNQYNEELRFSTVDSGVPNRGIERCRNLVDEADQFVIALDYQQTIHQIAVADAPKSDLQGKIGAAIHFEPGLWLNMINETQDGLDIARLGTIPHGDSLLAMGRACTIDGPPNIPVISGLPIGVTPDIDNNPYLGPYKAFHGPAKFEGLFDPAIPNDLLAAANQGVDIARTTILDVDTDIPTGGIHNIPFVVKQANATRMHSTFWIQELNQTDAFGKPILRLQYSQVVFLDFFPRADGQPGLIRWPHVSINTLQKVSDA